MDATNDNEFLYEHFVRIVKDTLPKGSDIRYGQHYFNVLNAVRPDLAKKIRATRLDPFYKENVPSEVEEFISRSWIH